MSKKESPPDIGGTNDDESHSMLDVVQDPDLLRERVEGLEAPGLERTRELTGDDRAHSVGENLRRAFGFRTWSNVLEDLERMEHPTNEGGSHPIIHHPRAFLDHLIHVDDLDKLRLEHDDLSGLSKPRQKLFRWLQEHPQIVQELRIGGTDWGAFGPKGSGKSTMALALMIRQLEINPDAVVWRGSPARAEWLPLRAWTRLCLPSGLDAEAVLDPPSDEMEPIEIDLERMVHEVVRYDSIRDLNHNVLQEGMFHVVYPDPLFRGATQAYREADEIQEIEHVSAWDVAADDDDLDPQDVTPQEMWWFAWSIDKIDHGPPIWVSLLADEIGNWMPEHASNDYHRLYDRISAFRDKYVDARRNKFSVFGIGHDPEDLASLVRKKQRWRITLAGADNPTGETTGMGEAPMNRNYANRMQLGQALSWNSQNFTEFSWSDIPSKFKVPGQLHVRFPEVQEVLADAN